MDWLEGCRFCNFWENKSAQKDQTRIGLTNIRSIMQGFRDRTIHFGLFQTEHPVQNLNKEFDSRQFRFSV